MRGSLPGAARLALALAVAAAPVLAQQPTPSRDTTRVTKDRPAATQTSTGETVPTAAPTPAAGAVPSADASAIIATMRTDADAMGLLHASNVAEIDAGNLAQRQARDSAVRAFAAQMVTDHTALDEQGTTLAASLGLTPALPDSTLPRLAAAGMAALGAAPNAPSDSAAAGAAFDQAYVAHQVADHQRTLALVDAAIARTQNAQLRSALETQVRPKVAEHLHHAQQLQQRLGGR